MSSECDKCGEHALECMCNDPHLTASSPLPEGLMNNLHCNLIHSKIPKRTENGIIWICKEGCDEK